MPYAQVNGIRMRYEVWGIGETALVMLHGLGSSADDWILDGRRSCDVGDERQPATGRSGGDLR